MASSRRASTCKFCAANHCDARNSIQIDEAVFTPKDKFCGQCPRIHGIYRVAIFWIIISCLLASTSTYLAFRSHLDPALQELTGYALGQVNALIYVGTWICFFTGILGPIAVAFICVMTRPAIAVPLAILLLCCFLCPTVVLYTKVYSQVCTLLNTTGIISGTPIHRLNISTQLSVTLEQEMWKSLNNYTWDGEDPISKAWDKVHIKLECCGVIGPNDWRTKRPAAGWICSDVIPEKCYKQYFKKRKRMFDCEILHHRGCFQVAKSIIEENLRNALLRLFIAIVVLGVWAIMSASCSWIWLCLRRSLPENQRRIPIIIEASPPQPRKKSPKAVHTHKEHQHRLSVPCNTL